MPSLTAALDDLGLGRAVVGRTAYCPPGDAAARVVGGTKDPDLPAIRELAPDVVLAVREENRREDVEALLAAGLSVEVFEPRTVEDAAPLARKLGRLAGDEATGERMADEIEAAIEATRELRLAPVPTAYLLWREPYLAAGPATWIGDVLSVAGFPPVVPSGPVRYPEVTRSGLAAGPAELVLLSSEPYPFREPHAAALRAALGDRIAVRLCRGELVGWYPSRLPAALAHLREIRATLS